MPEFIHDDRFEAYDISSVDTPEGRFYTVPTGEKYESVTTALKDWGDKSGLDAWRERVGEEEAERVSRHAAGRGQGMHSIAENYLNNEKNPSRGFMPPDVMMFKSIESILDKSIDVVYLQECALFSHRYKIAGRVDCVADVLGKLTIVDFKTSKRKKKRDWIHNYYLQTAAYSFMFEEMYGVRPEQVIIIIAVEYDKPQIFLADPYKYVEDPFFQTR